MARLPFITRRRLLGVAKTVAGVSATGTAGLWFWTRKCQFEEFGPETDDLFRHPLLKQINPGNKPDSHDMCVRRVPFSQLKPELLQDAQQGGSKLVEAYSAGMWGGYGYAVQRNILESFKDDSNREDVWAKEDLLKSTYEPGTYITNHFHVLEKTPRSLTMRGCFSPRQSPPEPVSVDNLVELRTDLDTARQVAVFKLKTITFDGTQGASQEPDPFGGFAGWLHRQYAALLLESAAENCMQ
ncbi:hypothetical protein QQZ08_002504 [Neonectria magnoliae]|uniref:Uncharacterized protein n=1 Tax=Neonectria magnoliae TaxID=2732573 RepID=A0ABR1IBK5_9HYPO